uniref:Uncharacterized protein n=1 Tax=Cannabis sativa TaxID=3483 RepID=A0A803Q8B9_CANSA
MADNEENDSSHPEETKGHPGKESMGSWRPPNLRTTCSTRSTHLRRSQCDNDRNLEAGNKETNTNVGGSISIREGAYDPIGTYHWLTLLQKVEFATVSKMLCSGDRR